MSLGTDGGDFARTARVSLGEGRGVGELALHYAPELDLEGVVAAEPSSNLTGSFPGDTPLVMDVVSVLAL